MNLRKLRRLRIVAKKTNRNNRRLKCKGSGKKK
jgi:hypothetical protein